MCCAIALASAVPARAQTEISLGNSSQDVAFQATSSANLDVGLSCAAPATTGPCTLSGGAIFDVPHANYTFTTTLNGAPITVLNPGGAATIFPVSMNGAKTWFQFHGAGDGLSGNVSWTDVATGSSNLHLDGVLTLHWITGDAEFLNAFGLPGTTHFRSHYPTALTADFQLLLNGLNCAPSTNPCTLQALFANIDLPAQGSLHSGVVSPGPAPNPAPEPSSIFLFGLGIVSLGAVLRYRRSPAAARSLHLGS
jgi:hypothetical protein